MSQGLPTFSANLGFLWVDLPLPQRVQAAARAGFDAVEVHFPYATPAAELLRALEETGLPLVSLNTRRGEDGEFGIAALPGSELRARAAIAEAIDYARAVGAGAVHVMAGIAAGPEAERTFRTNLAHAVALTGEAGPAILIEPINPIDVTGYFLSDLARAVGLARETGAKIILDCYHMAMTGHDPVAAYAAHSDIVGHVQFADCPGRGAPGTGRTDFVRIFRELREAGYRGHFGAEYRPDGRVEDSLDWMDRLRGA